MLAHPLLFYLAVVVALIVAVVCGWEAQIKAGAGSLGDCSMAAHTFGLQVWSKAVSHKGVVPILNVAVGSVEQQ